MLSEQELIKDIEVYLKVRNISHELIMATETSSLDDEKLKTFKLLFDIADKSIQNRNKLELQWHNRDNQLDIEDEISDDLVKKLFNKAIAVKNERET